MAPHDVGSCRARKGQEADTAGMGAVIGVSTSEAIKDELPDRVTTRVRLAGDTGRVRPASLEEMVLHWGLGDLDLLRATWILSSGGRAELPCSAG